MSNKKESKLSFVLDNMKFPVIAIVLSFIIGTFFILWTGNNPLIAYGALFGGSLGDIPKIGQTLLKTTPLIFTGLSVAFAFRTGLFNIGAEGQYVMGALFSVIAGYVFRGMPGFILVPAILISGALGGAIWAFIPGVLKAKMGIHEVIVTIMLNYTALFVSNFFIRTIMNPKTLMGTEQKAYSVLIPEHGRLTQLTEIFPPFDYSSVNTGIFVAILVAIGVWFILFKTTMGYELRSVGHNPTASEYGGISITKNIILSMVIAGALAGLAGSTIVAGLTYKIDMASASAGYGFTGISVALVGKNHPIGVLASALLFGIMSNGSRSMQIAGIPKEVVGIIQGIIIIFIAGEAILKVLPAWQERRKKKKELKKEIDTKEAE
ncbi:MAG: ABC transporter permease [Firmicutes bacterium]|jgi:simple sugar transport system permease protein|nr:ABC transporter permease [Bacillota bacterium]